MTPLGLVFRVGHEILTLWIEAAVDEDAPPSPQQVESFAQALDFDGFTAAEAEYRRYELQRLFVLLTQRITRAGQQGDSASGDTCVGRRWRLSNRPSDGRPTRSCSSPGTVKRLYPSFLTRPIGCP